MCCAYLRISRGGGNLAAPKLAFTLAEVLITLGIIGVVAAMTMPALISKYKKYVLEVQIKETYSIISQVLKLSVTNGASFDSFDTKNRNNETIENWYNEVFAPYLKVSRLCLNVKPIGCWHQVYSLQQNPYGENSISNDEVQFILLNGASFTIKNYSSSWISYVYGVKTEAESAAVFFFDANGKKLPNILGKDVHVLVWTEKGVVPAFNDKTDKDIQTGCLNQKLGSGMSCFKIIMGNGWHIPDEVWNR